MIADRRRSLAGWAALVLLLALATLAACAPRGSPTVGEPQPPPPTCAGCPELRLFAKEYAFEADRVAGPVYRDGAALAVQLGRTLIAYRNIGRAVHTLHIAGPGVDATTPVIGVGQEGAWATDLAPGEYVLEATG